MIEADFTAFGQLVLFRRLHQGDGVMVGGIAEKHHAALVLIGILKPHDLGPKFRGALEIAARINDVPDLLNVDGRLL